MHLDPRLPEVSGIMTESEFTTELEELRDVYHHLFTEGPASETTRVYNEVVQEFDIVDGEFQASRIAPDYDLSGHDLEIIQRAPYVQVPIKTAVEIIEQGLNHSDWTERVALIAEQEPQPEYTWYSINYGRLNGDPKGYLAVTGRYSIPVDSFPYLFRQPTVRFDVDAMNRMPELDRDLWTITKGYPEIDDIAAEFCEELEHISQGVVEVDLDGRAALKEFESGFAEDHIESSRLLNCIDIGLGDVQLPELRDRLCDLCDESLYQDNLNNSLDAGLNKQSISFDRDEDGNIRLTVSFAGTFDDVYDSVVFSNKSVI